MARPTLDGTLIVSNNHVKNITIIGAGGTLGRFIAEALVVQGKHKVTAITRPDSDADLPSGLHTAHRISYDDRAGLVTALQDQDVLIITLGVSASKDSQTKLIDAAISAGVRYIMPNEYAADYDGALADTPHGRAAREIRRYIEDHGQGRTYWIALTCSFWYEFSLAGSELRYGFDFANKAVTFFDDGRTKICTTSWQACGLAVAKLFALPIIPDGHEPALSQWHNRAVYITSFTISQRDMLESVLRVTGASEDEWTIRYENSRERYERGMKMMEDGDRFGMAVAMYSRVFFPDGGGSYSGKLDNEKLGMPPETLDLRTAVALQLVEGGAIAARDAKTARLGYNNIG